MTPLRHRIQSALNTSPAILAAVSGLLLTLAFPGFGLYPLAWVALVPLFAAVRRAPSRRRAFAAGAICGLVFFGLSVHWLIHVAFVGLLFVAALESFFFGLFALAFFEGRHLRNPWLGVLWIACAWALQEFLRSEVPVFGFGWNLLAYSQAPNLTLIQSANTVGAYGLGWVIAAVNAAIEGILSAAASEKKPAKTDKTPVRSYLSMIALLLALTTAHGLFYLSAGRSVSAARELRISVLQGNIPQELKWDVEVRDKILTLYAKLMELAAFDGPNLILWPEAAFPGYFNRDIEADAIRDAVRRSGVPTLIGAPHLEGWEDAYNSAYLLNADGETAERYDKQRLVPFGEYVPLKMIFGFLEPIAYRLGVSDFKAGKKNTVFNFMNGEFHFSVLICFEDIFPGLARRFTARGAEFLAVITNDAWFGPTAAPHQHLQASVFRAVENGVPVVRAANTGVSAYITRHGKVFGRVQDEKGEAVFVTGKATHPLAVDPVYTPYRRGGWMFPYAAAALFVIMLAVLKIQERRVNS